MFRLTLFALLLTFVALSYANPSGDPFELEEDYDDYEQGIFDNLVATRPCEGRIELVSNSGATKRYKRHCSLFLLISLKISFLLRFSCFKDFLIIDFKGKRTEINDKNVYYDF